MMKTNKGSLFFTVDTMIGALILVFTIIVVVSVYAEPFETREPRTILDNTVSFVTQQDMESLVNSHSFVYSNPREEFRNFRVHQKVAYLHEEESAASATSFVENITRLTVPDHLGVIYEVNGTIIFERDTGSGVENTQLSRSILTHYRNDSETFVGPLETRVMILS